MGKKLAILISVSDYKNEIDLPPCSKDFDLISQIISVVGTYDDVLNLGGSPESKEGKSEIANFIRKYQGSEVDEIFLYYTGHGTRSDNDFLYLFSDFDGAKKEQTSLGNREFDIMLKSLQPKLVVKFIDACQAGTEYIKSNVNFESILRKSSEKNFDKIYFFFSSSNTESSVALSDYSVFTKSFARSFLHFEGQDIRYRDIMAYIADDQDVKKHQTPLFIQQASNVEIFCEVSKKLSAVICERLIENEFQDVDRKTNEFENSGVPQESVDLIDLIKKESEKFCNEVEAKESLEILFKAILNYKWGFLVSQLYDCNIVPCGVIPSFGSIAAIAKWLDKNQSDYFINLTYKDEEYMAKEKVEIEVPSFLYTINPFGGGKRIEYQDVPRYRSVISGYDINISVENKFFDIQLTPKERVLPYVKIFFAFAFSKSRLSIFYKKEIEKELNWNDRKLVEESEWKINHCNLKSHMLIQEMVQGAFEKLEEEISELIRSVI
ncbi:caspase family protein [Thalassospira sp. NFXS8]|uniref:caspase family protein n=1 Tax=Thalassospira sp. NFXS8 TaxID=2819093 RepID=UPI0032DEA0B2